MSETTLRERMASLAKDRRGWIPFAVLGVLLLLLSTALVVSLDTREDPEPDIDEQLAFDRGEASAQAALRTALRDATAEAGDAPVTEVGEDQLEALQEVDKEPLLDELEEDESSWCEPIPFVCDPPDDPTFEDLPKPTQQNHIFENYVRLLVFEHASEQFEGAGQEIRDTETEISLQEPDDHEERIERVELTIGHEDNDLEPGMLGASVEDVDLRVTQDGELIDERTLDHLNVTVGSTLFELHNRTQTYEGHLQMGFFEGLDDALDEGSFQGFGQEFALRLYPVAYAKSGAKYFKPWMFDEIASNRQSELLANHAIYSIQEDVFGVNDPHSSTEMRIAGVCLGMEVAAGPLNDYYEEFLDDLPNPLPGDPDNETIEDEEVEIMLNETFDGNITQSLAGILADHLQDEINDALQAPDPYDELPDVEDFTDWACEALRNSFGDGAEDPEEQLPAFVDVIGSLAQSDDAAPDTRGVSINTSAAIAYQEVVQSDFDGGDWEDWQAELELEELTLTQDYIPDEDGEPADVDEELEDNAREDVMQDFYEELDDDMLDAEATSPLDAIETAYTVRAHDDIETDADEPDPDEPGEPEDDPPGENSSWVEDGGVDEDVETTEIDVSVSSGDYDEMRPDRFETFVEVTLEVEQEKTLEQDWECENPDENETCTASETTDTDDDGWAEATITVEGEYAPGLDVEHADDRQLDFAYTEGGGVGPFGFDGDNFDGMPEGILEERFEADLDELEGELDDLSGVVDGGDLEDAVYDPDNDDYCAIEFSADSDCHEISASQGDAGELADWLEDELMSMVFGTLDTDDIGPPGGYPGDSLLNRSDDPTVGQIEVGVQEFIENHDDELLHELKSNVSEAKEDIIYDDIEGQVDHNYDNVPDMARAQLYYEYVERLNESIETSESVRQESIYDGFVSETWSTITDTLKSWLGSGADAVEKTLSEILGEALAFGGEALSGAFDDEDDEEAGDLDSPMFENVTFEVHGSPTYLSLAEDDREDTAAVRPTDDGRFAGFDTDDPLDGSGMPAPAPDNEHSTMYAAYANGIPYPGLPVIPGIHVAQASLWNVQVGGEYPRFEVSATTGDPAATTSYTREQRVVGTEIGDDEVTLGEVEPLDFRSNTFLGVLMPPGGGVGDGTPEAWTSPLDFAETAFGCSGTHPAIGPQYEEMSGFDELTEHIANHVPGGEEINEFIDSLDEKIEDKINDNVPIIDPLPTMKGILEDEYGDEAEEIVCPGHQMYQLFGGLSDD